MRMTFWKCATRDKEETTPCGWLAVIGRDVFTSSHWGAAFNRLSDPNHFPIYLGFVFPSFEGFFDVHILKGPPGLFSNPEVKLERVYGVVTWETSGEMCMTSNFPLIWGIHIVLCCFYKFVLFLQVYFFLQVFCFFYKYIFFCKCFCYIYKCFCFFLQVLYPCCIFSTYMSLLLFRTCVLLYI